MAKITLYGKPGCHLCDEARADVVAICEERGLELEEVDISADPVLFKRYGERIPVVACDGEDLIELRIDAPALRRALGRVTRS